MITPGAKVERERGKDVKNKKRKELWKNESGQRTEYDQRSRGGACLPDPPRPMIPADGSTPSAGPPGQQSDGAWMPTRSPRTKVPWERSIYRSAGTRIPRGTRATGPPKIRMKEEDRLRRSRKKGNVLEKVAHGKLAQI